MKWVIIIEIWYESMADDSDLAGPLDKLSSPGAARALVVGDVMLDRFVSGSAERVSPEAPVPVLRVEREAAMLGGAGNVLRNLIALGARASVIGVVGADQAGDQVADLLARETGNAGGLLVDPGRRTTVKERYIAGGQQLLRADREVRDALDERLAGRLLDKALSEMTGAGALVLSDYGKGVLQPATLRDLIDAGRAAGLPVVIDPRGRDYRIYRGARVVTPNLHELTEATGLSAGDDQSVADACRSLIRESGVVAVLATRGPGGMTLVDGAPYVEDCAPLHIRSRAREVFDVSGAGDTVAAVLGAALSAGLALGEAARLANIAAGIAVGRAGTAVVRADELRLALHSAALEQFRLSPSRHQPAPPPGRPQHTMALGGREGERAGAENLDNAAATAQSKVTTLDALADRVERWRGEGLVVGFTNGCFELLHPGHLFLLRQAREACDRLIVAMNSDASVRRLKGEPRPVQSEAARAAVLASLGDVDQVVVFAEDTPIELIERLRPDVLVKGADYTLEQVVGAACVQAYGGRVLLAELLPGHATSAILEGL